MNHKTIIIVFRSFFLMIALGKIHYVLYFLNLVLGQGVLKLFSHITSCYLPGQVTIQFSYLSRLYLNEGCAQPPTPSEQYNSSLFLETIEILQRNNGFWLFPQVSATVVADCCKLIHCRTVCRHLSRIWYVGRDGR